MKSLTFIFAFVTLTSASLCPPQKLSSTTTTPVLNWNDLVVYIDSNNNVRTVDQNLTHQTLNAHTSTPQDFVTTTNDLFYRVSDKLWSSGGLVTTTAGLKDLTTLGDTVCYQNNVGLGCNSSQVIDNQPFDVRQPASFNSDIIYWSGVNFTTTGAFRLSDGQYFGGPSPPASSDSRPTVADILLYYHALIFNGFFFDHYLYALDNTNPPFSVRYLGEGEGQVKFLGVLFGDLYYSFRDELYRDGNGFGAQHWENFSTSLSQTATTEDELLLFITLQQNNNVELWKADTGGGFELFQNLETNQEVCLGSWKNLVYVGTPSTLYFTNGTSWESMGTYSSACNFVGTDHGVYFSTTDGFWRIEDDSLDTDQDGVPDCSDNCPLKNNTNQEDTDNDGQGDACDVCPTDPTNQCDTSSPTNPVSSSSSDDNLALIVGSVVAVVILIVVAIVVTVCVCKKKKKKKSTNSVDLPEKV